MDFFVDVGNRGCFETYGSMRKFKADLCNMLELSQDLPGERLREIVEKFENNPLVEQVIDCYLTDLTTGIINLVNLFAPESICLRRKLCIF